MSQQLMGDLSKELSPGAVEKIKQLVVLTSQQVAAPIAEQLFADRNQREWAEVQTKFKNHTDLMPTAREIIAQGKAATIMDAFRLANYANLEKIAQGVSDSKSALEDEKKGAFSKTGGKPRKSPDENPGETLLTMLKTGSRPQGFEKDASKLGF